MTMCEDCGVRPANIHLTTIVDGEKKEMSLCPECLARRQGALFGAGKVLEQVNRLLRQHQGDADAQPERVLPDIYCPACGMSYAEFDKSHRLGCAQCYDAFRQPLSDWFVEKHGASQHAGRVSGGTASDVTLRMKLQTLRRQQQTAIANEEYEQAAALRDQINALTGAEAQHE